jgi:hypothetical protein
MEIYFSLKNINKKYRIEMPSPAIEFYEKFKQFKIKSKLHK